MIDDQDAGALSQTVQMPSEASRVAGCHRYDAEPIDVHVLPSGLAEHSRSGADRG